ncbi:MAG: CPBP family intramembrane metalloprotease [Candidatus Eisenbacteria bacterium]|nr:CPBP family intramembrane metalloprotease [Candidatus Eisenbacteria bacterium]
MIDETHGTAREEAAPHAGGGRTAPSLAVVLLNQTIALAAVLALLFLFLPSDAARAVLQRSPTLREATARLLAGLGAPGAADLAIGLAAGALMIGWNVLYQSLLVRRGDHGRGEVRIGGGAGKAAAAYLLLSTSFTEEVIFRGWFFPLVAVRFGAATGLAASALLFTLTHLGKGIHGKVAVFAYGLILGGAWMITGSVWACVLAHATVNGAAFFGPFGAGRAQRG